MGLLSKFTSREYNSDLSGVTPGELKEKIKSGYVKTKKSHPLAGFLGRVSEGVYGISKKAATGKISRKGYKRTQRKFLQAYQLVGPTAKGYKISGSKNTKYKKTGRKAGRPRGTYKYYIPGKGPVDIYTFRQWYARQRNLERLKGPEQQYSQTLPTSSAYPTTQPLPLSQSNVPQSTNIFQERSSNILHAPNVFRGELRNVGMNSAVVDVDRLNKPVANVSGDYYVDVDPMSGRPILKRRIRERWLSG